MMQVAKTLLAKCTVGNKPTTATSKYAMHYKRALALEFNDC